MDDIRFEWEPAKARENRRKHVVSFDETITVFTDERGILLDSAHSESEERFALLGLSEPLRILVVAHCCREEDGVIDSSARKPTRTERAQFDAQGSV